MMKFSYYNFQYVDILVKRCYHVNVGFLQIKIKKKRMNKNEPN